jgi:hypothetical protein
MVISKDAAETSPSYRLPSPVSTPAYLFDVCNKSVQCMQQVLFFSTAEILFAM